MYPFQKEYVFICQKDPYKWYLGENEIIKFTCGKKKGTLFNNCIFIIKDRQESQRSEFKKIYILVNLYSKYDMQ